MANLAIQETFEPYYEGRDGFAKKSATKPISNEAAKAARNSEGRAKPDAEKRGAKPRATEH